MTGGLFSLSEFEAEDKAVLRLHVDYLSLNDTDSFRAACLALLQTGRTHLVIDLRYLRRVPSSALGAIIDLGLLCRKGLGAAGGLTVLARPEIAEHFERFTHSEVLDIQELQPEPEGRAELPERHDTTALAGG